MTLLSEHPRASLPGRAPATADFVDGAPAGVKAVPVASPKARTATPSGPAPIPRVTDGGEECVAGGYGPLSAWVISHLGQGRGCRAVRDGLQRTEIQVSDKPWAASHTPRAALDQQPGMAWLRPAHQAVNDCAAR